MHRVEQKGSRQGKGHSPDEGPHEPAQGKQTGLPFRFARSRPRRPRRGTARRCRPRRAFGRRRGAHKTREGAQRPLWSMASSSTHFSLAFLCRRENLPSSTAPPPALPLFLLSSASSTSRLSFATRSCTIWGFVDTTMSRYSREPAGGTKQRGNILS